MSIRQVPPLSEFFKAIEDPRIDRHKKYSLLDIIVTTILAIISGAQGWEDIDDFAKAKYLWLKKFLLLEKGLPGHDVYRRVFTRLNPKEIESCFMAWIRAVKIDYQNEVIAIDGKSLRGTFDRQKSLRAVHLVSAWASENRMTLAQVKVANKSNEITAIPELLAMIAIQGCIVTIDAVGCQYEIANKIVEAKADYVLSLKGNQSHLHDDVVDYFTDLNFENPEKGIKTFRTFDVDHGRLETRNHAITDNVAWLTKAHANWASIKSIGVIESKREIGATISIEKRYYVSTLPPDPELFAKAARSHWGIEASCHYVLDVAFREDANRITQGNAPENMAYLRKLAMTLVRMDKDPKVSIRKKMLRINWIEGYLEHLLFMSGFSEIEQPSTYPHPKKTERF